MVMKEDYSILKLTFALAQVFFRRASGEKVEEVFMPADKVDSVNESLIGKEVKLDYELSGNRAYLVDVTFLDKAR